MPHVRIRFIVALFFLEVLTTLFDIRHISSTTRMCSIAFKIYLGKTAMTVVILYFNFIASIGKVRVFPTHLYQHLWCRRKITLNLNIVCNIYFTILQNISKFRNFQDSFYFFLFLQNIKCVIISKYYFSNKETANILEAFINILFTLLKILIYRYFLSVLILLYFSLCKM